MSRSQRKDIKVLVTGFGPFPGTPVNPSETLIDLIHSGHVGLPRNAHVEAVTIPTSWQDVRNFSASLLNEKQPDLVLHFGVSGRANGFQIERRAQNSVSRTPDCDGRMCDERAVLKGGVTFLHTCLDVQALTASLRMKGLQARVSNDAGRYLCNMLLYLSLHHNQRAGFIHIPPFCPGRFGRKQLIAGTEVLLAECAST